MVFKKRSPALFLMTQILSTVNEAETRWYRDRNQQKQQGLKLPVLGKCLGLGGERLERVNSTRVSREVSTQCQGAIASRKCTSQMFESYFIRTVQIFSFR